MKEHMQGLGVSLLLHGTFLAAALALGASVVKVSLPIGIDFGLVQQESSCEVNQSNHIKRASPSMQKQNVVREHTVEDGHVVEQAQSDRPFQTSTEEAAVPVQAPEQMAAVEASPADSGSIAGQTESGRTEGGDKGSSSVSSSSGTGTMNTVPFGSAMGPRFVHRELPVYPFVARRMNKEGKVLLRLTIDEMGKLLSVEVIERAGFGLTEAAIEGVRKSTYSPARIKGRAVVSRALLPVVFEMTK